MHEGNDPCFAELDIREGLRPGLDEIGPPGPSTAVMTCANVAKSLRVERQHSKEVSPLKMYAMTVTPALSRRDVAMLFAGLISGAVSST